MVVAAKIEANRHCCGVLRSMAQLQGGNSKCAGCDSSQRLSTMCFSGHARRGQVRDLPIVMYNKSSWTARRCHHQQKPTVNTLQNPTTNTRLFRKALMEPTRSTMRKPTEDFAAADALYVYNALSMTFSGGELLPCHPLRLFPPN
jgi:hypothetical protein